MKVVLLIVSLAFASAGELREGVVSKVLPPVEWDIEETIPWEDIQKEVITNGEAGAGYIQADVTGYAYKVMTYIEALLLKQGFDPMKLSDQSINLFPGSLTMTNGLLVHLSTINISSTVIAKYTPSTDILELTLPLSFDKLLISYDYKVKIVLLAISGGINAQISNVKLDLHMGFNFSNYHAFVDKADVKNSGAVSITFTGQGIVDWVVDLLTGVLTTLFHQIILSVINLIIDTPVHTVVDKINETIDGIFKRNVTMEINGWNY